jgi:minimal CRISPR polymerase domain
VFISVDGDDVGRSLELYILDNRIEELENFAIALTHRFEWFSSKLRHLFRAQIHLIGGDSILASCEPTEETVQCLENLRIEFFQEGLPSISIGIGNTSREAYLALKYAKLRGKNRLVTFEDINDGKKRHNPHLVKL